jgi:hypothetical protein
VVIAAIAFFVSYIRYGEHRDRVHDVPGQTATATRGSGTAGAIVAPVLVGAVMLALAVVFAVGT